MFILSEQCLIALASYLSSQQLHALSRLVNRPISTKEQIVDYVSQICQVPLTGPIYEQVMSSIIMLRPSYDFIFSRDLRRDYHFIHAPKGHENIQDIIMRLQDFFGFLIDGRGYYSFQSQDLWVVAETIRTEARDQVGRPIYEVHGNLYDRRKIGDSWYWFVENKTDQTQAQVASFAPGEYFASKGVLPKFLKWCSRRSEPVSWAYGVSRKENDLSGLMFDFRFLPILTETPGNLAGRLWTRIAGWLSLNEASSHEQRSQCKPIDKGTEKNRKEDLPHEK